MSSKNNRIWFAAIPIILVNTIAVTGQFAFIHENWKWSVPFSIGAALAIESISVYLAYMHHEALIAEDAAYGLFLGSIGMGIVAGTMNASHYMPHWQPSSKGIILGILSASSPILWNIYSRRVSRDDLKAKGIIEPRAVKMGTLRWIFWTKETFSVFRYAIWNRENRPEYAIRDWEHAEAAKREAAEALANLKELQIETAERVKREAIESAEREAKAEREAIETREAEITNALSNATSQAESIRIAFRYSHDQTPNGIVAWLAQRGIMDVKPANVRVTKARERGTEPNAVDSEREGLHAV